MQKFTLELLYHIIGIGSASGLFYNSGSLYIISDSSHNLYDYNTDTKALTSTALASKEYAGPLENIPKEYKPDYEAVAIKDDTIYLFGSGSTPERNLIARMNLKTKEVLPHLDATDLYLTMQGFGQISPENFNIEAAVNDGDTWYLFNRGNGPAGINGLFTLTGSIADTSFQILYNKIKLPKINGARATFTDAIKVGDKLYFIAAAEKSASTYEDGEVAGTLFGCIDLLKVKVEYTQIISNKNKFEGLTLYKETGNVLELLLCEDTDSDATESDIYKLTINK
jgi:hypothetical protein